MTSNNLPIEIDNQIGERLSNRRKELNISLKEIAAFSNISYQQIQKYENGTNRIPASMLLIFATKLNVTVEYFYKNIILQLLANLKKY